MSKKSLFITLSLTYTHVHIVAGVRGASEQAKNSNEPSPLTPTTTITCLCQPNVLYIHSEEMCVPIAPKRCDEKEIPNQSQQFRTNLYECFVNSRAIENAKNQKYKTRKIFVNERTNERANLKQPNVCF